MTMDPIIPNSQQLLAHRFFITDMQVTKVSHQAILAIKRWNWISRMPAPSSERIGRSETAQILQDSCFSIVPNQYFLIGDQFLN